MFRVATANDAHLITRNTVQGGWHVGPYDFPTFVDFDSKGYHLCEIEGELAAHFGFTEYPKHHYHGGGMIVTEKFRRQGVCTECVKYGMATCDRNYTIGLDVATEPLYESLGFTTHWCTYIAMLELEKLSKQKLGMEVQAKSQSLHEVDFNKLRAYDQSVFGTCRKTFIQRWIHTPGSFGWVAIDDRSHEITGYTVLKQVIRGGGTEIGLAMAPLFADSADIAKFLVLLAAHECLNNPAIPKTKLEIFHPVGDDCGEGAAMLMKDLGADLTYYAYRMYTKGIPARRQTKKIYGIASPSCD